MVKGYGRLEVVPYFLARWISGCSKRLAQMSYETCDGHTLKIAVLKTFLRTHDRHVNFFLKLAEHHTMHIIPGVTIH